VYFVYLQSQRWVPKSDQKQLEIEWSVQQGSSAFLLFLKKRYYCCYFIISNKYSNLYWPVGRINKKPTRIRSKLGAGCCSVCRIAWLVGRKSLKIEFANSIGPFVKVFTGIGQKMELKNRILNLLGKATMGRVLTQAFPYRCFFTAVCLIKPRALKCWRI